MEKHSFIVVGGEYMGTLENLQVAMRKLHPTARPINGQGKGLFYSIEEVVNGSHARFSISIMPGSSADSGEPCYDVHMQGSSFKGDCKQLIGTLVTEAGIRVVQDPMKLYGRNGFQSH